MSNSSKPKLRFLRTLPNSLDIDCANCGTILAKYDSKTDTHNSTCDKLIYDRAVAVPNFGWFCSQHCGNEYEKSNNLKFQRDEAGKINYN